MTQATKSSRKTRASATRKKVWKPLQRLEIPESKKEEGMEYIWVRHELLNTPDDSNVHERLREGYIPVTPEELGHDYHPDVMTTGKHAGTVRSGDLILMKNTKEFVAQKEAYYDDQTKKMEQAYSAEYMQQGNPKMPVEDKSKTSVTGSKAKFEE